MSLSKEDKEFVEKRERLAKYWPFVGVISLAMVVAYATWLWLKMPHLLNPWLAAERLESGSLSASTMAILLPLVIDALLVLLFIVILLWFFTFRTERRLARLIRKLEGERKEPLTGESDQIEGNR